MPKTFEDFIHLPCATLKSIGYDFLDKPKSKGLAFIMRIYLSASLLCCVYVTYYVLLVTASELMAGLPNVPLFHRLLTDINYNVIAFLKCVYFIRHLRQNKNICKIFNELFPISRADRKFNNINEYFWPKWIKWILYFYFCSVSLIAFVPITEMTIDYVIQYFKVGYQEAKFGYVKAYEIPYSIDHRNPLAYTIFYIMECMNAHFAVVFNIAPDILLVAYAMQICMHFDCLVRKFESYQPLREQTLKDYEFIGALVKKHQVILNLCGSIKEIYSVLILIMFLSTAVTLCCAGAYVLSQGITRDLLGFLAFLPTSLGQYFMVCYYGQQIINKSLGVREAAYNTSWYNGSKSFKRCILVILSRTQKQAELNAGGFQTTNLAAFLSVVSLTYRAFTMLNTMFG